MNAKEQFTLWIQEVEKLDISQESDLLALFRKISDLNKITQQAEKEMK